MQASTRKTLLYSALVIFAGIVGFMLIMRKGPQQTMAPPPVPPRAVEIQVATYSPLRPEIHALGRVRSAGAFDLAVQVGGKILATADPLGLKSGLRLKRGELVCLVDTTDYAIELNRLQAQLSLAEAQHELAVESTELARLDLERINQLAAAENASRQAQEQARKVWIAAREKELGLASQVGPGGSLTLARDKARVTLDRCWLRAPFDCEVSSGSLVPGALVSPNMTVARLENMEKLEIQVELRADEASGLPRPGKTMVAIHRERADSDEPPLASGRFVHLASSLDPGSQLREARVEVDGDSGLVPGMLVEVTFPGRELPQALRIPRNSLQSNDDVLLWRAGRLDRTAATLAFADRKWAYLTDGPAAGDTLVLTPIQHAIPGLSLRLKDAPAGGPGKGMKGAGK